MAGGSLTAESCPTTTSCVAVGSEAAAELSGGTWSATTVAGVLDAVACASPTSCTAVGSGPADAGSFGLVDRFDGETWSSSVAGPTPDRAITGVACPSSTECVATAQRQRAGRTIAQILVISPTSVTTRPVRAPARSYSDGLAAVSCPTQVTCVVVGTVQESGGAFAAARLVTP